MGAAGARFLRVLGTLSASESGHLQRPLRAEPTEVRVPVRDRRHALEHARPQLALRGTTWHYVAQASSPRSSGCRDTASFPSCAPRGRARAAARAAPPFKVGVRECALADLDPRLEAFVAAGNFSPDLGARYLEFENLRQDTAYDFLLRPPTTASSGRFLCHEVPLSANIARLMPPWRPFLAPFSASD